MYAVVESGGQQYKVSAGDTIKVEKIAGAEKEIIFDKVLLIAQDENIQVGKPFVKGASVKAEIQGETKGPKVIVYKQKPRKGHRKLNGHRQGYTVLKITEVVGG